MLQYGAYLLTWRPLAARRYMLRFNWCGQQVGAVTYGGFATFGISRLSVTAQFTVAGAVVWNSLPDDITSSPTLNIFRVRTKTCLFKFLFLGVIVELLRLCWFFCQFLHVFVLVTVEVRYKSLQ
jgi:hypothetical protein